MSYYDNNQWTGTGSQPPQNNWEHQHQGASTPVRAGASAPQAQDEYAFSYQFDEVDRAHENLQKSGRANFMTGGRRKFSPMHHGHGPGSARSTPDFDGRMSQGPASRPHSSNFDSPQGPPGNNLNNFYASQRHQPSRGSNEAEQVMQAKRRMAAQRERELRNLHTEQQYQRNAVAEVPPPNPGKHLSEEETRDLIARQRNALYGEGGGYIDENGQARSGAPGPSGPPSLRGASPLGYDNSTADIGRPGSGLEHTSAPGDPSPRPPSTSSPQTGGPTIRVFDGVQSRTSTSSPSGGSPPGDPSPRPPSTSSPQTGGPTNRVFEGVQSRTSTSSPTGGSPPRDLAPGSKPGQSGASVAPIGTRPSGTPTNASSSKRSTPPIGSSGGWGRGGGVWGQSSGLGTQASVWG